MSPIEAECLALRECHAALDAGDKAKAEVWLRLADDAQAAQDWPA